MKRGITIGLVLICLLTIILNQNLREEDIKKDEVYKDLVTLGATDEILEYYIALELLTNYMSKLGDLLYLPENSDKYFDIPDKYDGIDDILNLSTNERLIKSELSPRIGEIIKNAALYYKEIVKDLNFNLLFHNYPLIGKKKLFKLPPLPVISIKALKHKDFKPNVSDYFDFNITIDYNNFDENEKAKLLKKYAKIKTSEIYIQKIFEMLDDIDKLNNHIKTNPKLKQGILERIANRVELMRSNYVEKLDDQIKRHGILMIDPKYIV